MKIQAIQGNNYTANNKSKISLNTYPISLAKSNPQNFGSWGDMYSDRYRELVNSCSWSAKLLRVLSRTTSEMKDLAEYFHNKSNDELKSVMSEAHSISSENARNAANRLIEFVTPIREAKLKMVKRISELEIKKALGISNATEQKTRLNREFISLISAEKEGKEPPIKNGILVHGTSSNKDGFINWLTESAGAVVKTIQHDSNNPTKTTDTLIDIAENSERAFRHSRTRTIVVVKDLDKMLTSKNSAEAMDNINEFKSVAEDLSKKYHTTIITKTDKPLDTFEPATIASNRLGLHIDLKDGISEEELKELGNLKTEVKRLDNKAEKASSEFKS